jgi:hypothetical protein
MKVGNNSKYCINLNIGYDDKTILFQLSYFQLHTPTN